MQIWSVITDVVILLATALLLGVVAQRFRQSVVVGYLVSGLLLGPGVLGVIDDPATIRTFAELGVVMLIFSIGLELPAARIRSLGAAALLAGSLQVVATTVLLALIAKLTGATWSTAWALGLVVAPSSTACVIRLLEQRTELDSTHGRTTVGILLLQDAALVPLILVMSLLGGDPAEAPGYALLSSFARMAGLILLLYLVVRFILPHALDRATASRNRELPLLLAIVVVLSAAGAAHALHISPVLGAFVAGILLAESPYALWIRADVGSLRTVFLTLFFASLAMLDDISWVYAHYHWLLISVPVVLLFKTLVVIAVTRVSGLPLRASIAAGLCLAQTGEFSFVLTQIGTDNGVLSDDWRQLIIATTVIALLVTPYLVRVATRVAYLPETAKSRQVDRAQALRDHVVVIGFGPAGQAVHQALVGRVPMVLVDLNPRAARAAPHPDTVFVTGDATQETVLAHACVDHSRAVVVTLPDHHCALRIIELVGAMAPHTAIFARARSNRYAHQLKESSTDVVDDELATGNLLAERLGRALGFRD